MNGGVQLQFRRGGFTFISLIDREKVCESYMKRKKYPGYQISPTYTLGDVANTITPKGLNVVKKIGFVLPFYIANYKGGRNECFMYGIERKTLWYDYDLTSAYTSVMSMGGRPEYDTYRRLTPAELFKLSSEDILFC
jgi:hypothetical protein